MKVGFGHGRFIHLFTVTLLLGVLFFAQGVTPVSAGDGDGPPVRQVELIVSSTAYEWWLVSWSDNEAQCQIFVNDKEFPSNAAILDQCGDDLFEEWIETEPCSNLAEGKDASTCSGVYLHYFMPVEHEESIIVDLPVPQAWISIDGCTPTPAENYCANLPQLLITAKEPLPNEITESIQGSINGKAFACAGSDCAIPLTTTSLKGVEVAFWTVSSYGDQSEHFTGHVRVMPAPGTGTPGESGWFVDVVSKQWRGQEIEQCAQRWEAFPSVGAPPNWLSNSDQADQLASNEPYLYLAGQLISSGGVDASACANNGLEFNGYASACGLEKARNEVDIWQDRFDAEIIATAQETGIPAQLLKNLFAAESQFWPGATLNWIEEFGLGHLSATGTDSVLLWNTEFFQQFCPLVLSEHACQAGYPHLDEDNQAILRGALAIKTNAKCDTCPLGIDLSRADFSIEIFAQTLIANCEQVGQMVYNTRGETAGRVSSYEDLWRFTLANYYAGPGCVAKAIQSVPFTQELNWEKITPKLDANCPWASEYVEKITQ
ncbi:MAG: hypothetical protein ABFS03_07425 [Chloroflexota bacterium]